MKNTITLDGEEIAESTPIVLENPKWEFYMRRKNKMYFRTPYQKIRIELNSTPEELSNLKYGTLVDIDWDYWEAD